ncbi:MAG: FAD-dependent oxidoreductase, partial [Kordia sp.]
GTVLKSDYTIIAADPNRLISNLRHQETVWKSCDTLYFTVPKRVIQKPLIGLIANKNSLINNIFYHNSVGTNSKGENELLSVTVVEKHQLKEAELIKIVQDELKKYCGIKNAQFLKHYYIKQALPNLEDLKYEMLPLETRLSDSIFLAGDTQLNGSLNAAMASGEKAALGIVETMSTTIV